ncbi:MAG TPA: PqqD family protein [Ignavibacteriaceae bacterium]|nr:PqqD family protein [Ignavibacteriaceae bacterium]
MALSFKERKKILKSTNTLDLTPIRLHSQEEDADGMVTVIIPKFKNKFMVTFLSPKLKSDKFRIKLDKFGSAVWLMIDSKSKVEQIIKELKQKFGEQLAEADERVVKFIFQLYSQGFISFKEIN